MICTEIDDHMAQYLEGNAVWVVTLDDDTVVYQDDCYEDRASAWERLYDYCEENNRYIKHMYIKFRSNVHHLQSGAHGYFFCKCATGHFGDDKTYHSYIVGTLVEGKLRVYKLAVPELLVDWEEERESEQAGKCLICQ